MASNREVDQQEGKHVHNLPSPHTLHMLFNLGLPGSQ